MASNKSPDYDIRWGITHDVIWVSDSGDSKDLDQVVVSEKVILEPGTTGSAVQLLKGFGQSGFTKTVDQDIDRLGIGSTIPKKIGNDDVPLNLAQQGAAAVIQGIIADKGKGAGSLLQFAVFVDNRTGYTDQMKPLIIDESGFRIDFEFEKKGAKYFVKVKGPDHRLGRP